MQEIFLKSVFILAIFIFSPLQAAGAEMSADEIMKKFHLAFYYAGDDMAARVHMKLIAEDGAERMREMTVLRKNFGANGEQKYFIYFHQPSDVRNMTYMVWKTPKKDSDRWLFIPALNMARRVAASDKHSSFVGSDFSYEDISGRDLSDDSFTVVKEEKVGGRDTVVIKSLPRDEKGTQYAYRLSWIDKQRWLSLKEEYYSKTGGLQKVFTAETVKEVGGFWTITKGSMKNVENRHRTDVSYEKVDYNQKVEEELFTERSLKNPPQKWIK